MLNRTEVLKHLPHGDPFVFVDQALPENLAIVGSYTITGKECFAEGHFPGRPIFPASIMVEALGQLGIIFLMDRFAADGIDRDSIFFIKSEEVSCRRQCIPGDCLEMKMKMLRCREPLIVFSGEIYVDGERTLKVSSLTLSFSTQLGS